MNTPYRVAPSVAAALPGRTHCAGSPSPFVRDPEPERRLGDLEARGGRDAGGGCPQGELERARRADAVCASRWRRSRGRGRGGGRRLREVDPDGLAAEGERVDAARAAPRAGAGLPDPGHGVETITIHDRAARHRALHRVRPEDRAVADPDRPQGEVGPAHERHAAGDRGRGVRGGRRAVLPRDALGADVDAVQVRGRPDRRPADHHAVRVRGGADEPTGGEVAARTAEPRCGGVHGRDRRAGCSVDEVVVAVLVAESHERVAVHGRRGSAPPRSRGRPGSAGAAGRSSARDRRRDRTP